MTFWNVSRILYKEKFRLPASHRDDCLESKSRKLQILQTLSSWESFCDVYLRENLEKGYLNTLNVVLQLTKNYAIAFSKFLKSLLSVSKVADLRQSMERQICLSKIKDAQFFCQRKLSWQFTTTVPIMISISYLVNVRKCQKFTSFTETTWNIFQIFTKMMSPI